ncbi:hypothetical protein EN933_05680, partial [Mesorhizobium sp. M7A.F.Ca.US.001.01.1.1]
MPATLAERIQEALKQDLRAGTIVWNDAGAVNRSAYASRLGVTRKAITYHEGVVRPFDELGPKKVPTETLLRGLLEAAEAAGTIEMSRANKINRLHYSRLLGGLQNTQYYGPLFQEFEQRLGKTKSTREQLVELLEIDFVAGDLKLSRSGKIDRTHYSTLVGVTKSALTPMISTFEEYEKRLGGGTGRFRERELREMRAWLETRISDGSLIVRRRRVGREAFKSAFGITCSDLDKRYPLVGVLLREFDGRLVAAQQRIQDASDSASGGVAVPLEANDIAQRFPSLTVHQMYKPGSARARLVLALNNCLRRNRMPRSTRDRAKISGAHFAHQIGVTPSTITQLKDIVRDYESVLEIAEPVASLPEALKFGASLDVREPLNDAARHVVSVYPGVLKHQHYPSGSTAKDVVQILNGQIVGGGLERSRGGKISRKVLTMQLGLSPAAMSVHLHIIEDYEDAVGGKESTAESKIPAMRAWFEKQILEGTLQIRGGKVSRIQFCEQFGLPESNTVLIRYPRIEKVVEEFDEKIRIDGYQPRETVAKLEEIRAILADDPPVGKEGLAINRARLAKLVGIPVSFLRRSPYLEAIEGADQELYRALKRDRLIAFAGGRIFKFGYLVVQGWPRPFAIHAKECFERVYRKRGKEEAKTHFAGLTELLSFIAGKASQSCRSLREGIENGLGASSLAKDFTVATQEYRDHLGVVHKNLNSRNGKIAVTNAVIRHLSAASVLPPLDLPLIGFRNDNRTHLRSIAEVTESTTQKNSKPHVDDYLVFATSMLKQAAEVRQIDINAKEQGDFTRALRKELEAENFTAADNPASLILKILDRRLDLIKKASAAVVQIGRADLAKGTALLERGENLGDDFDKILNIVEVGQTERKRLLRRYFPDGDDDREQGIANLLKVVAERYDFLYPASKLDGRPEGQFFQKRALEYGGAIKLQSYLTPSPQVVSSVLTLYLLGSGSNVSVGRKLYFECIETTDEPHHSKITGHKSRAKGKPIFVLLEDRSDAIQAMKWLQEAVGRIPGLDSETKKQLFICKGRGETFKLIEEFTFRSHFKRLIASIPELAKLPLTPNMLRPTILLKAALESDGRTRLSMAIGQHGRDVHEGYINKYPIRFLRDTEIRHFMHFLETVVISGVEEAHKFLGVDADSMGRRVEAVMKTGLGTLCRNRNGRPGSEGSACKSMDCWNDCPQLILIAKKEEIAILQVWQHSLRLVEGAWIRDQPERWEGVWLPWLCFVDAVEVKMRQSFASV